MLRLYGNFSFLIDVEIGLECMGKSSIFVGLIIRNADGVHRRME